MKKLVALICARGGSKGLPGKNIKPMAGKPLLVHSIEVAKKVQRIADVFVSTDDSNIAGIAKKHGARAPFLRPSNLATDTAPEWAVWRHLLNWLKENETLPEAFVVLPPTAPLRLAEDVEGAIKLFYSRDADGVICTTSAHRNPYFNMVISHENGRCAPAFAAKEKLYRRQDAPAFYDVTTVCYVMRTEFVLREAHLFDGDIFMYQVPAERSIDIDTQLDFDIAEHMMNRRDSAQK